jgi:hypothetical protein
LDSKHLEEFDIRLGKLERQNLQDVMSLLEIMSTATFFGNMKKANCEYAMEGQCSFFFLKKEAKDKLPIATDCRISDCKDIPGHCHLELSNITCTFCPVWRSSESSDPTTLNAAEDTKQLQEE